MRATMSRSAARSDSVTRSMSPLFDTCRARPNLSARIFPASLAVWMAKLSKSLLLEYRHNFSLDGLARDLDLLVGDVDVDLGADAEAAFEVDAGLDGEAGAGDDAARVARLEVVDVGAVAVPLFADGVARAVRELFAVAGALDTAAGHVVHFGGAYLPAFAEGRADGLGGGVAGLTHDVEDLDVLVGHRLANIADPGLVGDDGAGPLQLFRDVEEDEVAAADGRAALGGREVVRVGRVRADRDIAAARRHPLVGEAAGDEVLDVVLGRRLVRADAAGDLGEALHDDLVKLVSGLAVRGELLGRERGLELLDEVGAGDDVDGGHRADELDGAGVHARDVGDVVVGRVLHGDLLEYHPLVLEAAGGERVAQRSVKLLPTPVDDFAAGQRVEAVALDGVDDADGLADDGHVVEPAARGDTRGRQAQDAVGERVAAAEVVEEPA